MILHKQYNKLIEESIFICDLCGEEIQSRYCSKVCYICARNVCTNCGHLFDYSYNLLDPSYDCDHPDIVCKECWEAGKDIRERIQSYRDIAKEREEELWGMWREEAGLRIKNQPTGGENVKKI